MIYCKGINTEFNARDIYRTHSHLFGARLAKLAAAPARVAEAVAGAPLEKVLSRLESSGSGNGVGENAESHGGDDEDGGLELHLERSEVE